MKKKINVCIATKDTLGTIDVPWFSFDNDVENKILFKTTIKNNKIKWT